MARATLDGAGITSVAVDVVAPYLSRGELVRVLAPWRSDGTMAKRPRGERLRLALNEMGPIFVKFGQILSTRRDLLPPDVAAVLGTGGELVLPVLLVVGLFGRFGALGLSVVNAVAVLSLPEIAPAALQQHVFWGSLLALIVLWGPGRWSLDAWWWPRLLARSR